MRPAPHTLLLVPLMLSGACTLLLDPKHHGDGGSDADQVTDALADADPTDADRPTDAESDSTTDADQHDTDTPCEEVQFALITSRSEYLVPAGITTMSIKAWGAGGNDEGLCGGLSDAGVGGYSAARFAVNPGDRFIFVVGQRDPSGPGDAFEGFGGTGGGGLTGVFTAGPDLTANDRERALLIAGGGGSAARDSCGLGIPGNHESAGGEVTMQGGEPINGISGGGGGFEGGPAGGSGVPGTGGLGYVHPAAIEDLILAAMPGAAAPPQATDADYDGLAGTAEEHGLLVVQLSCE